MTLYLKTGKQSEIRDMVNQFKLPIVAEGAGGSGGEQVKIVESINDTISAVKDLQDWTIPYYRDTFCLSYKPESNCDAIRYS